MGNTAQWLVIAAVLLGSSIARAQSGRTALLLEPVPPGVGSRLSGQLGDLPWSIERVERGEASVERAMQLPAEAVFWLTESSEHIEVTVVDVERGRALTHRFDIAAGEELAASGVRETAALFIRGTLEALAAGAVLGVEHTPEPTAPTVASPPEPRVEEEERPAVAVTAHAGGTLILDGTGPPIGVALGAAMHLSSFYVGLRGAVGLPISFDRDNVSLTLSRYSAIARAGFMAASERFGLELGALAGTVLYRRVTDITPADLEPTGDAVTAGFAFGAEVGFTVWLADFLGIHVFGALLGVVGAPELTATRGDRTVALESLSPVQGTLAVALRARVFP